MERLDQCRNESEADSMMDVVSSLPDEMWVSILEYLPVHDRLEWVKFTNKRFLQLAGDIRTVRTLDFEGCSYVSSDQFLTIINRSKDIVRFLSFRDCAWFPNQICTTIPRLKNLVTLDILGCFLSSETLRSLLRATRSIKRLALSTTELVMKDFCRLQSKRGLSLRVLHVELLHDTETICSQETRTVLKDFIKTCCHSKPHCISVKTPKHLPQYDFQGILIDANCVAHRDFVHSVMREDYAGTYQNQMLIAFALHRHGSELSPGCLDEARVLCLPMLLRRKRVCAFCYCKGQCLPIALHELEYLICSRDEYLDCGNYCDPNSVKAVLQRSRIPKLTHLDFGRRFDSCSGSLDCIFSKLPSFTNLVELNVSGLDLDASMLLVAIMGMKHLNGLSFSLHLPSQCDPDAKQTVINITKTETKDANCGYSILLSKLVTNFPGLKKLELTCSVDARKCVTVSDLNPIGMLTKLRYLSLHRFPLDDVDQLAQILSTNIKLASLDLGHFETGVVVDFSDCFASLDNLVYLRLAHDDLESVLKFNDLHMSRNLQRFTLYSKSSLSAAWIESFLRPVVATCDLFCMCHIACRKVDDEVEKVIARYRNICESKYRNRVILSCSDDRISHHPVCQSWEGRSFSSVATYSPFDFLKKP